MRVDGGDVDGDVAAASMACCSSLDDLQKVLFVAVNICKYLVY